jgi:anti-sigma factor RsiW
MTTGRPACRDLVELVTDYLDRALAPAIRSAVYEHLRACDGCAAYVGQFRATVAVLSATPPPTLDPTFCARLLAAFRMWSDPMWSDPREDY